MSSFGLRNPTAFLIPLAALATDSTVFSQPAEDAAAVPKGALERIEVHGPSLEGNLEGDDPTRDVVVYLPPSYAEDAARRYPVVYFLHGYTATAESYVSSLELPKSADSAIAAGADEMIIVLPDAHTIYDGSMYSNSPTIGDWETYISQDLVTYIDAHYRTIPERESRGLAGHSMGGYGTLRIGMKRPGIFGALYAMSSCCLLIDPAGNDDPGVRAARDAQAAGEAASGEPSAAGEAPAGPAAAFANALFAQAAAWAPNPENPPRYLDLPFKDGELDPLVHAKWFANAPLVMVDQHVPSLKSYRAIAIDVGNADPLGTTDNLRLDAALTRLGVEHTFEEYEGDHGNRVRARFEANVLPFFSEHLTAP